MKRLFLVVLLVIVSCSEPKDVREFVRADTEGQTKQKASVKKQAPKKSSAEIVAGLVQSLNNQVHVSIVKIETIVPTMRNRAHDYTLRISYHIHNRTDLDITDIKGDIEFTNNFGDDIVSIPCNSNVTVPAGQSRIVTLETSYNPYIPRHKAIAGLKLDHVVQKWICVGIRKADGTVQTLEDLVKLYVATHK